MDMGATNGITYIKPKGEIYECPNCSYTDGFHISFNVKKELKEAEIVLICPSCHKRFQLQWKISFSND